MSKLGNRDSRVKINLNRQDGYDRIRPQGRGGFRALQSLGGEYCRDSGERDGGTGDVSERRGCAGRANPLLESAADGSRETRRVRRLSRNASQELVNNLSSSSWPADRRRAACSLPCILFLLVLCGVPLSGCGHKHTQAQVASPPTLPQEKPAETQPTSPTTKGENEKVEAPPGAKPIFEETGMASWYGAPYHNRRGSNGEIYDMNAMTAAHLTLPLGSIVRITNLKTEHSAVVRITDRGPFVPGRIVDLSLAAAKALDVYLPGTAKVRLEVLQSPVSLDSGGRWAVQIGWRTACRNVTKRPKSSSL
jgi:rare lipoprotein A